MKTNKLLFVSRRLALEPWYGMGYVESLDEHFANLLNRCTKFNYRKYRTNIAPELVKIYIQFANDSQIYALYMIGHKNGNSGARCQ